MKREKVKAIKSDKTVPGTFQPFSFVEIPARKKPGQEQQQKILVKKGDIKIHRALARIPLSVWIEWPGVIMEGLRAMP